MSHCQRFTDRPLTRREMLTRCSNGFGAVALASLLSEDGYAAPAAGKLDPFAPRNPHFTEKVKNVIFLYMDGGPSQVDTFDPKPRLDREHGKPFGATIEPTQFDNIGTTMACPWKFKKYGQSGIEVSELFQNVAEHVDDMVVIRSMTSEFSEHTNANYFLHTGNGQQGRPSMGSWVTYGLGSECRDLPGFIVLNGGLIPSGGVDNFNSGFLPASYQASIFQPSGSGVAFLERQEASADLQRNKLELLRRLDHGVVDRLGKLDQLEAAIANYEMAARMQSVVPSLTDVSTESAATQEMYGLNAKYKNTTISGAVA